MAEIESGETYSGIKFKGLNSWVAEVGLSLATEQKTGTSQFRRKFERKLPARLLEKLADDNNVRQKVPARFARKYTLGRLPGV